MGKWDQYQVAETPAVNKWAQYATTASELQAPTSSRRRVTDVLLGLHPAPFGPSIRETPRFLANVADTALLGLIPDRWKDRLPPIESTRGKITDVLGQGAALTLGGPGRLGTSAMRGIERVLPGLAKTALGRIGAAGVGGAVTGAVSDLEHPAQIPVRTGAGAILGAGAGAVGETFRKGAQIWSRLRSPAPGMTIPQMGGLSETELAKLPPLEREAYFASQTASAQKTAQAQAAEFARLTAKQKVYQAARETSATSSLPETAAKDLKRVKDLYPSVRDAKQAEYKQLIQNVMKQNPNARFTGEEVFTELAEQTLDDPVLYRAMEEKLRGSHIVEAMEKGVKLSPTDLLEQADALAQQVGRAVREKTRAAYPDEFVADRLRNIILRLMEKRGVDVTPAKEMWKAWVPQRNVALKLQTPQGPSALLRIVSGKDPDRKVAFEQFEALAGERLDRQTKEVFGQLNYLKQQEVLNKLKQLEQQRVAQQQTGFTRESLASTKLRIEQQARHYQKTREILFATAKGAAGAVGAGAVAGTGVALYKLLRGR